MIQAEELIPAPTMAELRALAKHCVEGNVLSEQQVKQINHCLARVKHMNLWSPYEALSEDLCQRIIAEVIREEVQP